MTQQLAWRNIEAYRLAIEHGRYRAALRECIAALRRGPLEVQQWSDRLVGCFRRRHR